MRIMKKAISFALILSLLLALSVSALAADAGYGQYIKLSKEPLDRVHITGTVPAIAGNPEVPIDDTAYLMPDDATLSISLPSGGTYFEGMSMLDFPAGSGDPGWDQPLVNERLYSDGLYTYRVYTSDGTQLEEFRYITKGYADKLTGLGFTITTAVEEEPSGFADVPADAYYADPVAWAVEEGITTGTSANKFSPDATCTRAQIITFLWRAAGSPEPKNLSGFSDVDAEQYYAKAVAWAKENDMADGDTFAPNDPCTRLMAVEFMWKYVGSPDAAAADFEDVSSGAVNWAVEQGVTNGTSATTFAPDTTCTRAQIVTFLYRGFAE